MAVAEPRPDLEDLFQFSTEDGRVVFRITTDLTFEMHEAFSPQDAAKQFVEAVGKILSDQNLQVTRYNATQAERVRFLEDLIRRRCQGCSEELLGQPMETGGSSP